MDQLITTMFSTVSTTATGLGSGIKEMFLNLIWENPTAAERVLSDFSKFSFMMLGVGLVLGLGYVTLRALRSRF